MEQPKQSCGRICHCGCAGLTSKEDKPVDADFGVILDAYPLDAVLDVGQAGEGGYEPAVAETALLDVGPTHLAQELGLLEYLVHALDGLGHRRIGIRGRAKVELGAPEAVQAMALFHLKVPVLRFVTPIVSP